MRRDGRADHVHWLCPSCRDAGVITGWRGTQWDITAQLQTGEIVSLFNRQTKEQTAAHPELQVRAYELIAEIVAGPIELARPVVRRVRIGGNATLSDLHDLLRQAFEWVEDEPYEFLLGAPYEPESRRFTGGVEAVTDDGQTTLGDADSIVIETLGLAQNQRFGYMFDYGEEWIHRVTVASISDEPSGRVTAQILERTGPPAPQHPEYDELWEDDVVWTEVDEAYPMTALYGPYLADVYPDPETWLAMDELEQLLLVSEAHTRDLTSGHPPIESMPLHAVVHCLAETQLASGNAGALAQTRIRRNQGISRHQAIHELGERLVRDLLRTPSSPNPQVKRGTKKCR